MIALIDGDILVYRVGFASENQTEAQNCMNTELVMEQILADTGADDYMVFLSDKLENNFRFKIDPQYKANRIDARKPRWYDSIRQFLVNEFKAEFTPGQEADDALGIVQSQQRIVELRSYGRATGQSLFPKGTVICSIDKDLLQVPGKHYNITTREQQEISHVEGLRHFYKQLLIGDRVDNIEGIYGIGKVKAGRILDGVGTESEMFGRVQILYGDDDEGRLLKNGQLLWIRRYANEVWTPPLAGGEGHDLGLIESESTAGTEDSYSIGVGKDDGEEEYVETE